MTLHPRLFLTHTVFSVAFGVVLLFNIGNTGWGGGYSPFRFIYGLGVRPYIYRVLVYWVLEVFREINAPLVALLIPCIALFCFVVALHLGWGLSLGQVALALAGLIPLVVRVNHFNDLPTLALSTACLAALAHRRLNWFLCFFFLACLNRETSFLLIILFAWHFRHEPSTRGYLVASIIIYCVLRAFIIWKYATLPGGLVEWHLGDHLPGMLAHIEMTVLYSTLGALVTLLVLHRFRTKPALLQRAAIVMVPIITIAYFFIGYPFEFRVLLEAYTPVFLLALPSIKTLTEVQ